MTRGAAIAATMATAIGPLPVRGPELHAEVTAPAAIAWDDDGIITYAGPR